MVQTATSATKIAILLFVVWAVVQSLCIAPPLGITAGGTLLSRLTYPFFHASPLHAALNAWCLLSLVFLFRVPASHIFIAYAVAISIPVLCLPSLPVLGASGVCFAIMGMLTFSLRHPAHWQVYLWLTIVATAVIPNIAFGVHAWCFAVGTFISLLINPIIPIKP